MGFFGCGEFLNVGPCFVSGTRQNAMILIWSMERGGRQQASMIEASSCGIMIILESFVSRMIDTTVFVHVSITYLFLLSKHLVSTPHMPAESLLR